MQQIATSACNSGLGNFWVGLTDLYTDGQFKYWSSGQDYDSAGAAWSSGSVVGAGTYNCAAISNGEIIDDWPCDHSYYALCELEADVC